MSKQAAINAAAGWWAGKLTNPPEPQTGDTALDLTLRLGALFLGDGRLSDEQIADFRSELAGIIAREFELNGDTTLQLTCEYGPDKYLHAACARAGFESSLRFPSKSLCLVSPVEVRAKCGYGAPVEQVYAAWVGAA